MTNSWPNLLPVPLTHEWGGFLKLHRKLDTEWPWNPVIPLLGCVSKRKEDAGLLLRLHWWVTVGQEWGGLSPTLCLFP